MSKELDEAQLEIMRLRSKIVQLEGRNIPWAAKDGYWNGDMLHDWLRSNMETNIEIEIAGQKLKLDITPYLHKPIMKWKHQS